METIKFIAKNQNQKDFAKELNKRIRTYFKQEHKSTFGDYRMIMKAFFMLGVYLGAITVLFTVSMPAWFALILMFIIGVSMAGIGMGVMHDAAHGSFSKHQWVNTLMSRSIFLLGSSVVTWRIQHNVLHHTYPNVHEWDRDIDSKGLRLSSHSDQDQKIYKYQHIFGPLLYIWMTIARFVSDFKHLKLYRDMGALEATKINYKSTVRGLIIIKAIYLVVFLVLPFIFTDFTWWQILLGFFLMHFTGSVIMGTVFQLAHVVENLEEPLPNEEGEINNQFAVHQLETTADFGRKNGLFSWYIGGLNFQVEHHLFPHVCHIHYPQLAAIVEKTAADYNQPYHCEKSAFSAFRSHIRALKRLGTNNQAVAISEVKA